MKAVLMTGNGGFDRLVYRDDIPVPVPGTGDVLIRVGAAGVNNTDINTRTAWYSKSVTQATGAGGDDGFAAARTEDSGWTGALPQFPRIQGADVCGVIVEVGAGVRADRIGERVIVEPVFRDPGAGQFDATYLGSEVDGGFAEFCRVPSRHAYTINSALTDIELASFPCAYSAAENMLARAAVVAGEQVLVCGASGGVGSAAVQLAKRRGAIVTAIAAADKLSAVAACGADRVISRDTDIMAQFGAEHFHVVIDSVGGDQFGARLDALKRGGRYAVAGAIAGPIVSFDLRTLYLKDLRLIGCTVLDHGVFANLVRYIEAGEVMPLVSGVFPLSEIVAAQTAFLTKQHVGKIVLVP